MYGASLNRTNDQSVGTSGGVVPAPMSVRNSLELLRDRLRALRTNIGRGISVAGVGPGANGSDKPVPDAGDITSLLAECHCIAEAAVAESETLASALGN